MGPLCLKPVLHGQNLSWCYMASKSFDMYFLIWTRHRNYDQTMVSRQWCVWGNGMEILSALLNPYEGNWLVPGGFPLKTKHNFYVCLALISCYTEVYEKVTDCEEDSMCYWVWVKTLQTSSSESFSISTKLLSLLFNDDQSIFVYIVAWRGMGAISIGSSSTPTGVIGPLRIN